MSDRLALRRHLYEQRAGTRLASRRRRAVRRQIAVVDAMTDGGDDGAAGVREPRRPSPGPRPTGRPARA